MISFAACRSPTTTATASSATTAGKCITSVQLNANGSSTITRTISSGPITRELELENAAKLGAVFFCEPRKCRVAIFTGENLPEPVVDAVPDHFGQGSERA